MFYFFPSPGKDCHARQLVWAWPPSMRAPVTRRSNSLVCVDGHRGGVVKLHCLLVFYLETDSELELGAVLTEIVRVVDFQTHYKLTVLYLKDSTNKPVDFDNCHRLGEFAEVNVTLP